MKGFTLAFYNSAPTLACLVMFPVYTRVMGKELDVETVYSSLPLLNLLRNQVRSTVVSITRTPFSTDLVVRGVVPITSPLF
jgi:hypothetical protein